MFRARITGVYVAIITLALALLVRLVIIDAQPMFNGFNGLTDLGWFHLGSVSFDPYQVQTYYLVAVALSVVLVLARWLITSKAGLILQSFRDDENRARYLGYDVAHYKLFFFAVSAGVAGFAGMLYVIAAEFTSPTFMDISFSVSMIVWAAVGGRNSLLGACLGAILLNVGDHRAPEPGARPDHRSGRAECRLCPRRLAPFRHHRDRHGGGPRTDLGADRRGRPSPYDGVAICGRLAAWLRPKGGAEGAVLGCRR
jgi:ABC-type branched-subunit amino acid transport system permease subunit